MIIMVDLLKAFGPNEVFQGLDSVVERGEIRAIIYGSGSLKSVILKRISGSLKRGCLYGRSCTRPERKRMTVSMNRSTSLLKA